MQVETWAKGVVPLRGGEEGRSESASARFGVSRCQHGEDSQLHIAFPNLPPIRKQTASMITRTDSARFLRRTRRLLRRDEQRGKGKSQLTRCVAILVQT